MPVTITVLAAILVARQPTPREVSDTLVADLRDDHVEGNATTASQRLWEIGPPAVPPLETALDSADLQQRELAAWVLRHMPGYSPSPRLLRACADALRNDAFPDACRPVSDGLPLRVTMIGNASDSMEYLVDHPAQSASVVAPLLDSADPQQQFLAGVIAANIGLPNARAKLVGILVPHLSNNKIVGDATLAALSLARLGPEVEPSLRALRDAGDDQHKAYIDQILLELGSTRDDIAAWEHLAKLPDNPESLLSKLRVTAVTFRWDAPLPGPHTPPGASPPPAR